MKKKFKQIEVSTEFLVEMLKSGGRRSTDLPHDATFVRMYPTDRGSTYWIVLHSDEWRELAEGEKIPRTEVTVTDICR